jgi:hypothetical protein
MNSQAKIKGEIIYRNQKKWLYDNANWGQNGAHMVHRQLDSQDTLGPKLGIKLVFLAIIYYCN